LLKEDDAADFIVVNNLKEFKVQQTYINGLLAAENGISLIERVDSEIVNSFNTGKKSIKDFEVEEPMFVNNDGTPAAPEIKVIQALEGQLITKELHLQPKTENGKLVSDSYNDILKIAVMERYKNGKPAVAFIRNFGLKKGAIASCVAHDSHNIIAVGVSDIDICNAVNAVIASKGGISVAYDGKVEVLPLPVAGIMTNEDGYEAAEKYSKIDSLAKELGSSLKAPFMTLSFMALLVIPQLKLSDKGLFDGSKFEFVNLEVSR
jgi:adenine deaminase